MTSSEGKATPGGSPLTARDEALVHALTAGLEPVHRLQPPVWRVAAWIGAIALGVLIMLPFVDWPAVAPRIMVSADAWLAIAGSALTAVAAVIATVRLGLPDASHRWALLPLAPAVLWLGASGVGCMRIVPPAHTATSGAQHSGDCFLFIVAVSVPLALALALVVRRSYTLHPHLMAQMAGLACAAASATLLVLIHPFQISWLDLAMHALAVALVMLAAWAAGSPTLKQKILRRSV